MTKATYTRRFNKLKAQLREATGSEIDDTVALRWGPEACIVAHDGSFGFTLRIGDSWIEIVKGTTGGVSSMVGIHVTETDLDHMMDQIETAIRDGFEKIIVHSIGKAG